MRTALATVVVLMLTGAAGCEKPKPEPTFKGRPRSEWTRLAADADAKTRERAYGALGEIGRDSPPTVDVLRRAAATDADPSARAQAAISLYAASGETGPAVAAARSALTAGNDFIIPGAVCRALKGAARPLEPDILALRSRAENRSLKADLLDDMLEDIRKP
jgi:hypothetical protein